MIDVRVARTINRPADEVFAFISEMANNPRWQNGMRRCEWVTPPPVRVGSRYDQEARFLGRKILSTFEVTIYEPSRVFEATTVQSSFPITFHREVHPIDGGSCRVQAIITGDASGFFRIAEPLLRRMTARSINGDYDRLKVLLEQEAPVPVG